MKIPFNRPYLSGKELAYIKGAVRRGHISGNGYFTGQCQKWLEEQTGCHKALLTHSCTAALEMAAILADIKPGDEVIMPSYTFVSTANAFVLRGGLPVFIDIRPDTMNMDESLIEAAVTEKTKAVVPVHYAGVACEMDTIITIAEKFNLLVIEDCAQGVMCTYKGKQLGSIGHLGTLSFHETKNIISGEGGALLINDPQFAERAEIIWEKGTNRSKFFRGEVDKYSWVDIGSSYLPSDIIAAFLYAQMENADAITKKRLEIWRKYYDGLSPLAENNLIELPTIPNDCIHNAHMFYIKTSGVDERSSLINYLKKIGVHAVFHYVPLHSSKAGKIYGRFAGEDRHTTRESERLLRLPLYQEINDTYLEYVIKSVSDFYGQKG
jgi:dTDP-4-amino-4,6-dideoxygalactose transaminase